MSRSRQWRSVDLIICQLLQAQKSALDEQSALSPKRKPVSPMLQRSKPEWYVANYKMEMDYFANGLFVNLIIATPGVLSTLNCHTT
jgi:hypothetical protein